MGDTSLRRRITWLNISMMFCILVPVGVFTFTRESRAVRELLDNRLAESGRTISALVTRGTATPQFAQHPKAVISVDIDATEPSVGYQVFDSRGAPIVVTADFDGMPAPTAADLGFRTALVKGTPWRLYTLRSRSGSLVRIGERYEVREEITRGLVLEHSLPLIVGLPLLALFLGIAVSEGLRPLSDLAALLAARSEGDREPLVMKRVTSEMRPLIESLNHQFARLQDALERERRFNADVAHELRTPLAAALIQLENASLASDRSSARAAIAESRHSLGRLGRRIEQILVLSRLEVGAATGTRERCELVEMIKQSIEELAHAIAEKEVDASFDYAQPQTFVIGHEASLMAMFRNLIENALRYVQPGGQVAVKLASTPNAVVVEVCDNGPGIPPERRELVFNRFHRENHDHTEGLGLGLSIVQEAAKRHGAKVELEDPEHGSGLRVRVTLPRAEGPEAV